MLHSIQGRIVLGSVAIATIVLAILGVLVGEEMRRVAGASVAVQTRDELQSYVADLRNQPDEKPDQPNDGQQILVVSPQGKTVIDTLPPGLTSAVLRSGSDDARVHVGGASYLAVGETLTNARGTWRLWAVRNSVTADLTVQGVARVLLLAAPVLLALAALGSWLLVRAALRPVRRLRTAADRISTSGVPGRLPEGRGRDELAELTKTLNRFLEAERLSVERERRMVDEASHELRTPLAVLTTQLELAHRDFGDARALENTVRAAQSSLGALSRLTTQLLELSQLGSDGGGRAQDRAPVSALVSEAMAAVDRARALAPEAVRVEFDVDDGVEETALTPLTPTAFARIVDNLAINAIRATERGVVELRLDQREGRLVLTVTDTGTGVPPDFLPRAFDRFTRSERSRAAGAEGSGLGLALVHALVRAAGGEVTLANGPSGGAIATVVIPLSD